MVAFMSVGVASFVIGLVEGGLVWGLVALTAVGVVVGVPCAGLAIWDRLRPAPQPLSDSEAADLAELKRPKTASEEAAALLEYVRDILARARLSEDDRDHLVDLEQRLALQVAGADLVATSLVLVPYDRNEAGSVMHAELIVELLVTGGGGGMRTVPEWTPPAPSDREALVWFQDNVFRIVDADYEAWSVVQEPLARRGRRGRLPTR